MSYLAALHQILLNTPGGNTDTQMRLFTALRAAKQYKDLVVLAGRADLDPAVDELIGTITAPTIRAAWLARPGRSLDALAAAGRKQAHATIVDVVARVPGLPADVYETIAGRKHRAACTALLENPSVTAKAAETAFAVVAGGDPTAGNFIDPAELTAMHQATARHPHLAVTAVNTDQLSLWREFAGHPAVTGAVLDDLVTRMVAGMLSRKVWPQHLKDLLTALLANINLTQAHALRLVEGITQLHQAHPSATSDWNNVNYLIVRVTKIAEDGPVDIAPITGMSVQDLAVAASEARLNQDGRTATAIVLHPLATPAMVKILAGFWQENITAVLSAHQDRPDVQAAVLGSSYRSNAAVLLERTVNPSAVLHEYLTAATAAGNQPLYALLTGPHATDEHLLLLQPRVFLDGGSEQLRIRFVELVSSRLSGPHQWGTFEALIADGNLTLGECLETAKLIDDTSA
jgi:hypothetical protein